MKKIFAIVMNNKLVIRMMSLGDQIFFSAANFLLTIILARHYPEYCLAGYGVGLTISLIFQGIQRTSYVAQNSVLLSSIIRRRAKKILGQQLLLSGAILLVQILGFTGAALILGVNDYFIAIACSTLVCSLIYLQLEFDRIILVKHERLTQTLTTSLLFLLTCSALFFLAPSYDISFPALMGVLALFSILKYIWLIIVIGRPDFFWGWQLLKRDFGKNLTSSMLGVAGFAGFSSAPIFILGAVSAPIQTAAFGAMRSLTQPIMILVRSMDVIDKVFFQGGRADMKTMQRNFFVLLAGYSALSIVTIITLWTLGPMIVNLVYGQKYSRFSSLLTGWGVIVAMYAISSPLDTVIIKLNKLRQYNVYRVPAGLIGLAISWHFCASLGAWGALIGCIAGWVISVLCGFWLIREILFLNDQTQHQKT